MFYITVHKTCGMCHSLNTPVCQLQDQPSSNTRSTLHIREATMEEPTSYLMTKFSLDPSILSVSVVPAISG